MEVKAFSAGGFQEVATMMGSYLNAAGPSGVLAMLLMIAMWAVVIAVAAWSVVRFTRTGHRSAASIAPDRAILDRRFTAGEIDAETYAQARRVLQGQHALHAGR
jgi:uncharacterized membrane protein